jgi:MftR C-terminal domain
VHRLHSPVWREDSAAGRLGQPADSLYPPAVGRATLATCRGAYDDRWAAWAESDLTVYLDAAFPALAAGFKNVTNGTTVTSALHDRVWRFTAKRPSPYIDIRKIIKPLGPARGADAS